MEDSDQPGYPPSLISLRCPHEEAFGPWLPSERTAKTDQSGRTPRLIWVFARRTCHSVGFVVLRLIYVLLCSCLFAGLAFIVFDLVVKLLACILYIIRVCVDDVTLYQWWVGWKQFCICITVNRAYSENANFKTCAPSALKFHWFCGLHQTKKCWKFEFDILNILEL